MADTVVAKTLESILAEKRAKVNDATLESLANKQIKLDAMIKEDNKTVARHADVQAKIKALADSLPTASSDDITLAMSEIDQLFY